MNSFLMIGQSNMAGRGDFFEVPEIINEKAFMLRNGRWQPMSEPINPDRSVVYPFGDCEYHSGIGLSASFADEYAKYYKEDVGLIPCADGGTCLDEWLPGELLFDNAVTIAKLAMRTSELTGILWHQGENDAISIDLVNSYYDRFIYMMNTLKQQLGVGDIPIIVGELGSFVSKFHNGEIKYGHEMNLVLHKIANDYPNCAIASSEGLTCRYDNVHFNSKSYREFGKRYFKEYISLYNRITK